MSHAFISQGMAKKDADPTPLTGGVFHLQADFHKSELLILSRHQIPQTNTHLHRFGIETPHCLSRRRCRHIANPGQSDLIHVSVQAGLLNKEAGPSQSRPAVLLIADAAAAELAMGLLDPYMRSQLGPTSFHYAVAMLCERLAELGQPQQVSSATHFHDWQLSVLSELLSSGPGQNTSLAHTAMRCGLSACHFSRLFKAAYGQSFHKFLIARRIKQAQARLSGSSMPISQIALECGFSDQSGFTRCFGTATGVSPAQWRKQSRVQECLNEAACSAIRPQTSCTS